MKYTGIYDGPPTYTIPSSNLEELSQKETAMGVTVSNSFALLQQEAQDINLVLATAEFWAANLKH